MNAAELTYSTHSSPMFYEVARWLEIYEQYSYRTDALHHVKECIQWEQDLTKQKLGLDYPFIAETNSVKVIDLINEFTQDELYRKTLHAMFCGLYEIAIEYVQQIIKREKL